MEGCPKGGGGRLQGYQVVSLRKNEFNSPQRREGTKMLKNKRKFYRLRVLRNLHGSKMNYRPSLVYNALIFA